ncbi:glycerophosphoryl diester phosphodiesterase [Mobiluncus mulieris]|uniref:Glycerophosphoryl diester phosphodiesterase n=1 Tax=Mobiluncus mulieris TaxID=2052 RepID=A0A7Y0U2G3_9ACTO|nr:glycerophosphodiester phosphodiesterase family protein [Mobiluncus mulieris]NMW65756.1 glycerophosphoryl diester phosphodiesterase [Mobiluncus mulieris]
MHRHRIDANCFDNWTAVVLPADIFINKKRGQDMSDTEMIFAHRGLNQEAPENTMAAFRLAHQRGATWMETDVDVLGDGTVIICHDTTLDRTTDRAGSYYGLSAADLDHIDAGSWFAPDFRGERIPRLSELIQFMNETGMNCNIEVKSNEAGKEMTLMLINNLLAELEKLDTNKCQVIISCFNHVLLSKLKEKAPKLPIGCLYETCALYDDWKSLLELVGADYIHPEDTGLTREKVQAFRQAGFGVNVWTVNDIARANQLFNWGATGVFTDIADRFVAARHAK